MKTKGIKDFFADNYFDLLPGQTRTIHVRSSKSLAQFQKELEIITLGDDYQ
jgi:beta-mannosidase